MKQVKPADVKIVDRSRIYSVPTTASPTRHYVNLHSWNVKTKSV